jgi:DNA-binding transcriptional MocR family regulator
VQVRVPQGGYCLWVELPPGISMDELHALLAHDGVHVSHGRHFFATESDRGCFRMSISRTTEAEIEAGVAILGRHLRTLMQNASRSASSLVQPYV